MIEENEIIENEAINNLKRFLNQRQKQREENTLKPTTKNYIGKLTQMSTFAEPAKYVNEQINIKRHTKTHIKEYTPLRKTATLQRYDYQNYRKSKKVAPQLKKHVSIDRGIIKKPESLHTFSKHSDISSKIIQQTDTLNNLQEDKKTTHNSLNFPLAESINDRCNDEIETAQEKIIPKKITLFDALNFQDIDDILYIIKNLSLWSRGLKFSVIICLHIFILIFSIGFWYNVTPKLTPMVYLEFMQTFSIIDGIVIVSMFINSLIFLIGGLKNA